MKDIATAKEVQQAIRELEEKNRKRIAEETKLERTDKMGMSKGEKILQEMLDVLTAMKTNKPNDRSDADRRWAIAITDYEKTMAVFHWFVVRAELQEKDTGW